MLASAGNKGGLGLFNEAKKSVMADVIKEKLYSFGVIPQGLLEHEIFSRYEPKFEWLLTFFQEIKPLLPTLCLEAHEVWPLVALMGMEDALQELLAADPRKLDVKGRDALVFLAIGEHTEIFKRWVVKHHPDFVWQKHSRLMSDVALVYGKRARLDFLINTYDFQLWRPEFPHTGLSALYGVLRCGYNDLFWQVLEALKNTAVDLNAVSCLPVIAAEHKQWKLCNDLIRNEFPLTENDKAMLVFYAARDSKTRFLTLIRRYKEIDFRQFNINGNNVYTYACEGGNIDVVDHLLAEGWFNEVAPDFKISRATGFQVAVQYGQLALAQHLLSKFGDAVINQQDKQRRDVFDYVAMSGNWDYFQDLAKKYRHPGWVPCIRGQEVSFLSTERTSPLNGALRHGHVYFAQRYILQYGAKALEDKTTAEHDANQSGNPVMCSWLSAQTKVTDKEETKILSKLC